MNEPNANSNPNPQGADAASRNSPLSLRDRVQSLRLPDRPMQRRSPFAAVPWILCLILLGTTIAMAMRTQPTQMSDADIAKQERDKSVAEAATPAGLQAGDVMIESKGYIVPIHQIQVSPKVSGMVMSLRFEEGMVVKKGDILAVLEDIEYKSERNRSQAQVDSARSRWEELSLSLEFLIKQAEADLEDAKAQYTNEYVQLQSEINSRDAASAVDVLKRKATVDAKKARVGWHQNQLDMINRGSLASKVAASKAELGQFEAELVKAEWRLSNCVITAPVTGMILVKRAEEGSLVNPSAFSNGLSASLCDMADLGELEVDLSIPERDIERLIEFRLNHKNAQKCQVRADAFRGKVFEGYVSRIMPTADRGKGAVPVRVKIVISAADAGIYLRPDMGAAVTFLNSESGVSAVRPLFDSVPVAGGGKN